MQIASLTTSEVETGKNIESAEFNVDPTIAMLVLRDKIYKNPTLACVREILSNARDANRENKKAKTPIEVSVVEDSSPTFSVKDSGVGISRERLRYFTSYGSSTKRKDNKQTGGWGLGCKSPFAVSDQFTVDTVWEDKESKKKFHTVYLMFINESNRSSYTVLSEKEAPVDAITGTEIKIPVSEDEIYRFKDYAEQVTRYWDHPLTKNSVRPKFNWDFVRTAFKPLIGSNYADGEYCGLVLDGIHYHFDAQNLPEFPSELSRFANSLTYFFNTGDLDVNPTREDVNYTSSKTFESIYNSVTDAHANVKAKVVEELKPFFNFPLMAAIKLAGMGNLKNLVGKEIVAEYSLPTDSRVYGTGLCATMRVFTTEDRVCRLLSFQRSKQGAGLRSALIDSFLPYSLFKTDGSANAEGDIQVVINDLPVNRPSAYVRGALLQHHAIILLSPEDRTKDLKESVKEITDAVGSEPALRGVVPTLLSSYPKTSAPQEIRERAKKKKIPAEALWDMQNTTISSRKVSSKCGGVVVVKVKNKGYAVASRTQLHNAHVMGNTHYPHYVPVWGVSPKCVHLLGDGWITPDEHLQITRKRLINQGVPLVETLEHMSFLGNARKTPNSLRIFANKLGPCLLRTFLLRVLDAPYVRIHNSLQVPDGITRRLHGSKEYDVDSLKELQAAYPMLFCLDTYTATYQLKMDIEKEVISYIRGKKI